MFLLPSCAFVHSEDRSKARPCAASAFRKGHPGFSFNIKVLQMLGSLSIV